ncbi:MAG: hypothetical protein WC551_09820 [Patescibacteria group bacterium]
MRDREHYRRLMERNGEASVGFNLAAAAVYAARHGICESEHHATEEYKKIARRLKQEYGNDLSSEEVLKLMDKEVKERGNTDISDSDNTDSIPG